jgi:hypothetical protein
MGWSIKTWGAVLGAFVFLCSIPYTSYIGMILFAGCLYYANAFYKEDNKPKEKE